MTAHNRGFLVTNLTGAPAQAVRIAVELALAALVGWLLAGAIWLAAFGAYRAQLPAPQPMTASDVRAPQSVAATELSGLFSAPGAGAAPTDIASLPETRLSLNLFGVRTEGGGTGSAILEAGASGQRSILVGGEIEPGVVLHSVHEDYVVITRRGAREVLYLDERSRQRARAAPQTAAQITLAGVRFTLVESGGWRLEGGPGHLAAFGLGQGDVVTHVDGTALDRDSASRIEAALAGGRPPRTLTIERQGARIVLETDMTEGRVP
jgi:general secretion pathway protein C